MCIRDRFPGAVGRILQGHHDLVVRIVLLTDTVEVFLEPFFQSAYRLEHGDCGQLLIGETGKTHPAQSESNRDPAQNREHSAADNGDERQPGQGRNEELCAEFGIHVIEGADER